jgi:hypothetical protein
MPSKIFLHFAKLGCYTVTVQDKAAHGHILAVDTHINFPIEKTTERSWR